MSDNPEAGRLALLPIQGIGFQGEGWARVEPLGFISTPHTWPGDVVDVRYGEPRRGRAWAEVTAWHARSPERVDPACDAYDRCSGCALRHVSLDRELDWKEAEARSILTRYGPGDPGAWDRVDAGTRQGHRTRGRFSCAVDAAGAVRLGLRAITLERELLDLRACPAQSPRFLELLAAFGAALDAAPTLASGVRSIELRTGAEGAALACVELDPDADRDALLALTQAALHPLGAAVALRGEDEEPDPALTVPVTLSGWGVAAPASLASWIHATPASGERMIAWVRERLGPQRRSAALDLCSGVGTVTAHLASLADRVVAIDADHRALIALNAAAAAAGVTHVQTRAGRAALILRKLRAQGEAALEVAVINPMRLPLGPDSLQHLPGLGVREIVYLGPSPVSAARDAAALLPLGFHLQRAAVINLHPGTAQFMLGLHLTRALPV